MQEDPDILTARTYGVPFESLYIQIRHEWFGLATGQLVHAGFMFDPDNDDFPCRGSFPALWRLYL